MSDAESRQAVEPSDVPIRRVLVGVGLLVGLLVLSVVLLWFLYRGPFAGGAASTPVPDRYHLGALALQPRLQVNPQWDLERLTAAKTAWLSGYGWVNREAEAVRVPIEQAMESYVDSGWRSMAPFPRLDRAVAEHPGLRPDTGTDAGAPGDGARAGARLRSPSMQNPTTGRERVAPGMAEQQPGENPPAGVSR